MRARTRSSRATSTTASTGEGAGEPNAPASRYLHPLTPRSVPQHARLRWLLPGHDLHPAVGSCPGACTPRRPGTSACARRAGPRSQEQRPPAQLTARSRPSLPARSCPSSSPTTGTRAPRRSAPGSWRSGSWWVAPGSATPICVHGTAAGRQPRRCRAPQGDTSNLLGCLMQGEQLPTTTYTAM
jgi:hypothetical protein